MKYICKFRWTPGRWLVDGETYAGSNKIVCFSGQRIMNKGKGIYDTESGYWLHEAFRVFGQEEAISVKAVG